MTKGLSYKTASLMLDDKKALVANTDYTVSQFGLTVTFDIKPASLIGYKEVEVYFDTILNSEAAIATDIPNTSELEYSNTATSTYKIKSEEPTVHTGEYKFKNKNELVEQYGYNPYLLNAIQPMGGFELNHTDFVKTGNGYETCLYVFQYPKIVDRHWLAAVTNNPASITTIDVESIDSFTVKKDLKNGIAEYKGRMGTAKNTLDAMDADEKRIELSEIAYKVQQLGEVIKRITTRIYVVGASYTSIDNLIDTQVVIYNIAELSGKRSEIFDAQLFNALSLCWANAVKTGSRMKRLYEEKQIAFADVRHFLLLIDESHKDYDYMVTDYGCASSAQLPSDFYSNDIRIVVCGGNAEEVASLTTLSHQFYRDESIIYIFSFIDPDDRPEVLDLMGDRREMVHFAPYTPDCFRSYEESGTLYRELLGFREEQTVKPKRGFGRKRRR